MVDFRLYLVSDRHQCTGRSLIEALTTASEAGVRAVQIREKDLRAGELLALSREVQSVTGPRGVRLFINDRADIARAVGAAGVHLPEAGLTVEAARKALGPGGLIGVSTHSGEGARRAGQCGADYITFGPVFSTPSKAAFGPPAGVEKLEEAARAVDLPVFAIGGVRPDRVRACLDAGAHGVAVISAILSARDVRQAVGRFRKELGEDTSV